MYLQKIRFSFLVSLWPHSRNQENFTAIKEIYTQIQQWPIQHKSGEAKETLFTLLNSRERLEIFLNTDSYQAYLAEYFKMPSHSVCNILCEIRSALALSEETQKAPKTAGFFKQANSERSLSPTKNDASLQTKR